MTPGEAVERLKEIEEKLDHARIDGHVYDEARGHCYSDEDARDEAEAVLLELVPPEVRVAYGRATR